METGKIEVRKKNQVTIPKAIIDSLDIQEGDVLDCVVQDGKIIITPKILIPKDQAWFWSSKWQTEEKEVQKEFEEKGIGRAYTADELMKELNDA
ncbi:MAG: AbrB/MazE/SpoVT family DNA-binding domain-containing protein [Syntrophomonas sp.]